MISYDEALALTREMVAIPSINGTEGERKIAEFIENWLRDIPYFQENPAQIIIEPLKKDPFGRRNVIAYVKGTKADSKETILLHGHHDTVGIDDFGSIREYAFDCDALPAKIRELTDDPDVLADIDSGNWLFGRGGADMKSGLAVGMLTLRYFSERTDTFAGNLLFMTNPVEENQHTGIIEALGPLERLKEEKGFSYKLALNLDNLPSQYPGDTTKVNYSGAGGKVLPCFYVMGKPTHVGTPFQGLSASMVVAEIIKRMELGLDFISSFGSNYTIPPTVLKMKDLKPTYDVQTAISAFVYFNLFLYDMEMTEVFQKLCKVAEESMGAVAEYTNSQYRRYCEKTGAMEYHPENFDCKVMLYRELYEAAKKQNPEIDEEIRSLTEHLLSENTDRREITLEIVRMLCAVCSINTPTTIVFLAPPYLPKNRMKLDNPQEAELHRDVKAVLEEYAARTGDKVILGEVNPFPTDSSYLRADDSPDSLAMVVENFPNMEQIYYVPVEQIKRMNIPAFIVPGRCKDAHKWTERLDLEYTFRQLPRILDTIILKELT